MQKIILDTIEQLNKEFGEYCPIAHKTVVSKKLADFIKQALTKSFEAGQKSREKEIADSYNKALGDMFIKIAELAEPDERQPSAGDLHTNMDNIHEIRQSLSLTKE